MAATLREVAEKLNLSPGLVSKVLNDRPGTSATDETRRRIRQMARELDYRPNAAAQALRSGKTNTVAFVFLRPDAPGERHAYSGVIESLAECLGTSRYDLLVKVFADQKQLLERLSHLARARACDAVILWGTEEAVEEQGALLEANHMPFVVKGRHEERHAHWPQVDFDHEAMMAQVVEHLSARGHRRIAFLGFDVDGAFRFRLRDGYRQAMHALLGHPVRDDFLAELPYPAAYNEAQMRRWLALPPNEQPTAIAIGAGNMAWEGVERALARVGRRIGDNPGEVALAGTSSADLTLLFGQGYSYQHIELPELARSMGNCLLIPLLSGATLPNPVARVRPLLRPVRSLNLLHSDLFSRRPQLGAPPSDEGESP